MKTHTITGGGGVQLHLVETGNPKGRPILFLHGISQSWFCWNRQMNSDLAGDHRLVAMDMRGHGLSDKPRDAYADSKLWADDINAAIKTLQLDHPILSGWSYGPLVILDYIRHYGEQDISGVNFIGAMTKLGNDEANALITAEIFSIVPGFFATDVEESVRSLESLIRLCFKDLSEADRYHMLGYNMAVPPHVRQALFSRSFHNDDLLPKIRKPVLITHGTQDAVVKPIAVEQHKAGMPHAQIQMIAKAGHAPFWDDAATFNQGLRAFSQSL